MPNTIESLSEKEAKDMLQELIENSYIHVTFPDVQEYMEEEWFNEEAIFDVNGESSSYLIPTKYIY